MKIPFIIKLIVLYRIKKLNSSFKYYQMNTKQIFQKSPGDNVLKLYVK